MDELNLSAVVEQLQHENERLREQLSKVKLSAIPWQAVLNAVKEASQSPLFWIGCFIGVFVMFLIGLLDRSKDK